MKKIAQGIVRFRKLILTVAFLLLIPSAIGAVATRINYDILTYLPQDLDSMIGEVALEDDFHLASTGMITVEGLPTNELIAMKKDIEAVPGVTQTFWLSDVIDPSIPTEMLPADVQQAIIEAGHETTVEMRALLDKQESASREFLKEKGMVFCGVPTDEDEWMKRAVSIWPQFYPQIKNLEIVEAFMKTLGRQLPR